MLDVKACSALSIVPGSKGVVRDLRVEHVSGGLDRKVEKAAASVEFMRVAELVSLAIHSIRPLSV